MSKKIIGPETKNKSKFHWPVINFSGTKFLMTTLKKKKKGLFSNLLSSKVPDSDIILSEYDGLQSFDEPATVTSSRKLCVNSGMEETLHCIDEMKPLIEITNVFFNLADEKRVEVDLTKVKEISFATKVKYSLEIHFLIHHDIGEDCILEEKVKLLYKETVYKHLIPKTFVKKEEKYVVHLPQREMVTDRFSKTEIYIRILDKNKTPLNFICVLYDVKQPLIKI